jgi:DNA (cytosine-5)-methyltransferase 1
MTRPLLLDLFCGAGGAATGYHQAGFDVIGVDNRPQPHYPFEFQQGDALEFAEYTTGFDAIHASPPCQHHTTLAKGNNNNQADHPDLIAETRRLLHASRLHYVIENVPSAPLHCPITLCGEMFGLDVIRHRLFETNTFMWQPPHLPHRGRVAGYRHGENFDGPYFAVYGDGGGKGTLADWQQAMGIDWMTKPELAEAIPPAYTHYIGTQLLEQMERTACHPPPTTPSAPSAAAASGKPQQGP